MKRLHLLLMSLATLVAGGLVSSCSSVDEPQIEPAPAEGTAYEVSLSFGGEYAQVSEEPMTKADDPKKLYGINVYCMKTDGTESEYSHYAYGVFDNTNISITLLEGYKYKFECTSTLDGDDVLYISERNNINAPFNINTEEINSFTASSEQYLSEIQYGSADIVYGGKQKYFNYPRMDRFYGELADYVPQEGGTATIPMKRTAFGLKIVAGEGVPDGSLTWEFKHSDDNYYYEHLFNDKTLSGEETEASTIYTFYKVYECWKQDAYTEDFTFIFKWKHSNGYEETFEKVITVKRNVMTVITVNLKGGSSDVPFGFDEEKDMGTENVSVDFSSGTDTNVNPQE